MKTKVFFTLIMGILSFGCQKEVQGPKGDQGIQGESGPEAETRNFSLTFQSGDTYKAYNPNFVNFKSTDVVLVYFFSDNYGSDYYVQTPYVINGVNIYSEFSETDGNMFINTVYADGTSGSPWGSSATLYFKAVHISSKQYELHKDIDYSKYSEVKKAFKLK